MTQVQTSHAAFAKSIVKSDQYAGETEAAEAIVMRWVTLNEFPDHAIGISGCQYIVTTGNHVQVNGWSEVKLSVTISHKTAVAEFVALFEKVVTVVKVGAGRGAGLTVIETGVITGFVKGVGSVTTTSNKNVHVEVGVHMNIQVASIVAVGGTDTQLNVYTSTAKFGLVAITLNIIGVQTVHIWGGTAVTTGSAAKAWIGSRESKTANIDTTAVAFLERYLYIIIKVKEIIM